MISNKALATLFLIILNMQHAAASSPKDPQESSPSGESTLLVRKRRPVPKPEEVLVDTTNDVSPVEVQGGSTEVIDTLQEQPTPQKKSGPGFFETLMSRGRYDRVCYFAGRIGKDKFLKRIYPLVKTLEQYYGIVGYLKSRKSVASFYVHGDIGVVKGAIVASRVYVNNYYVDDGDLETALPLALEKDKYDRFMELLDIRKGITAKEDERRKLEGGMTGFEMFVFDFLFYLAPWENGMALRRFLVLHGDELRSKYPDILDTLCQELLDQLRARLDLPKAESLLVDLIGQPSLLTHVVFTRGFLNVDNDGCRSDFIKYGWREAFQEGLNSECECGGEKLWLVMREEKPGQFPGEFPETEEERTAACMRIPTKQQMEEEWIKKYEKWIKKNALILFNKLKPHGDILNLLPDVIWTIITEYAVTLNDIEDLTVSQE